MDGHNDIVFISTSTTEYTREGDLYILDGHGNGLYDDKPRFSGLSSVYNGVFYDYILTSTQNVDLIGGFRNGTITFYINTGTGYYTSMKIIWHIGGGSVFSISATRIYT